MLISQWDDETTQERSADAHIRAAHPMADALADVGIRAPITRFMDPMRYRKVVAASHKPSEKESEDFSPPHRGLRTGRRTKVHAPHASRCQHPIWTRQCASDENINFEHQL